VIFRFGSFELDEETGEFRERGAPVAIQPKPLELLRVLLRERDRIVTNDELFRALWPDTVVTPGSLTRAVSLARRAIGDTHKGSLIRSHPRRGYRFTGRVLEVTREDRDASVTPTGVAGSIGARGTSDTAGAAGSPVGREDSLAALHRALAEAWRGRGRIALVSGPPGIGKTHLVEHFAGEAAAAGALVLTGRAREGDGVPAYWLWGQIVRQLLDAPLGALGEEIARDEELAALLPEGARPAPDADPADEASDAGRRRFLLFDHFTHALVRASRERPLVLVLEDLQWAMSGPLRLLEHLAYESADSALLLVGTIRDEPRERSHPLHRTLPLLRGLDRCQQIALERLSRGEVARLLEQRVGRRPPAELTSELYARTEGVPLFLREAIRLLEERGELRHPMRAARQGVALPEHALGFIRRALDALPETCLPVVTAASVIGRDFALPLVAAVANVSREAALDAFDTAERAGVMEPVPDAPASWRFTHALFQEAAYDALTAGTRARLHYRAAQRLERQNAEAPDRVIAELAHHHHRGLAVGDPERAYACAMRAARRAAEVWAYEQSAGHYEQAAAALDHREEADPYLRLETLLALGSAYRLAGERTRRREVLGEAMGLARSLGRAHDFARAAIGFCDISEWSVHDPEAAAAIAEAMQRLDDDGSLEWARLATRLAYLGARGRRAHAESAARRAVELTRCLDHPAALQEALYVLQLVLAGPDDFEERATLSRELAGLARGSLLRDPALIAQIDSACDALALGDADAARRRRARAADVAGERPHPGLAWHMRVYDTGLALLEGRLEDAEAAAEEAAELGRRIEHPYGPGCYSAHCAELAALRGDTARVIELMEPGLRARGGPQFWVKATLARAWLREGRGDAAREIFESMADGDLQDLPRNIRWTRSVVELAHLCADLDDAERARPLVALLSRVEHHHAVLPVPICYGGPVSFALARLAETLGRPDDAAELHRDAREAAEALGARPTVAAIRETLGRLLARRGEHRRAREALVAAEELAETLGMAGLARSARAALAGVR